MSMLDRSTRTACMFCVGVKYFLNMCEKCNFQVANFCVIKITNSCPDYKYICICGNNQKPCELFMSYIHWCCSWNAIYCIYTCIHNSVVVLTLDRKILMYKHKINSYSRQWQKFNCETLLEVIYKHEVYVHSDNDKNSKASCLLCIQLWSWTTSLAHTIVQNHQEKSHGNWLKLFQLLSVPRPPSTRRRDFYISLQKLNKRKSQITWWLQETMKKELLSLVTKIYHKSGHFYC